MSRMGTYESTDKYKNYSLPTFKNRTSGYQEKVWTLQEQIYLKLKHIAQSLESLYPKLTAASNMNIKVAIEKNLETLSEDLNLMTSGLQKNPDSFNTKTLKTNQHRIDEMKHVCDNLQTISSYESEFKNLSKIKHTLTELEHLIQPTSLERSLQKTTIEKKTKKTPTKKKPTLAATKKKTKPKSTVKSQKKKVISKKAKPKAKSLKPPAKKVIKPKKTIPTKRKKTLTAKSKAKIKK